MRGICAALCPIAEGTTIMNNELETLTIDQLAGIAGGINWGKATRAGLAGMVGGAIVGASVGGIVGAPLLAPVGALVGALGGGGAGMVLGAAAGGASGLVRGIRETWNE